MSRYYYIFYVLNLSVLQWYEDTKYVPHGVVKNIVSNLFFLKKTWKFKNHEKYENFQNSCNEYRILPIFNCKWIDQKLIIVMSRRIQI